MFASIVLSLALSVARLTTHSVVQPLHQCVMILVGRPEELLDVESRGQLIRKGKRGGHNGSNRTASNDWVGCIRLQPGPRKER